jgi:hypothetical protein
MILMLLNNDLAALRMDTDKGGSNVGNAGSNSTVHVDGFSSCHDRDSTMA